MADLPGDDDGPLSQDALADPAAPMPNTQPAPKQRSNKRKLALPAGSADSSRAAAPAVWRAGSELPDLPDDVEGDLAEELLEELALAGRPAGPCWPASQGACAPAPTACP